MKYMLACHKVADNEAWKKVFDSRAFVNSPKAEEGADVSGVLDVPDCWCLD